MADYGGDDSATPEEFESARQWWRTHFMDKHRATLSAGCQSGSRWLGPLGAGQLADAACQRSCTVVVQLQSLGRSWCCRCGFTVQGSQWDLRCAAEESST
eukprot:GSA25T00005306001.1